MSFHLSRSLALVSVLSLTACAANSDPGALDEGANASTDSQLASSQNAFSFFVATKAGRGFAVTRLNGGWMRCAGGWYGESCPVAGIELTTTGLSATDASSIVDGLGHDARRPTMIFVGRVVSCAVGPKLEVFEMCVPLPRGSSTATCCTSRTHRCRLSWSTTTTMHRPRR